VITRVYIDNFRCFSNFEIEAERVNLLIGANGSGKGSFIGLITRILALTLDGHGVESLFPAGDLTRWDERLLQTFELDVRIERATYRYKLVVEHDRSRSHASIKEERVTCGGRTLFAYAEGAVHLHNNEGAEGTTFPFRGVRSFLAQIEERPETTDLNAFLGDDGQLFLISHHPEAIDFLAAEHPLLYERPDGGPVRVRKTIFERESGLKASEQIARGLIGGYAELAGIDLR